nr:hypothetical protein [Lachnospiraceae bacterium]
MSVYDPGKSYEIKKVGKTGGTISIKAGGSEVTEANAGTTVTVKATSAEGYVFDGISVIRTSNGRAVSSLGGWYTANEATFVMPNSGVTVTPIFTEGSYAISMQKNGSIDVTIPEGVNTVRVYDDGGPDGHCHNLDDDWLTLTAPEGRVIRLTGNIKYGGGGIKGWLTVYDSDGSTALIDQMRSGTADNVSTDRSMRLHSHTDFYVGYHYDGLDLTATVGHHIAPAAGLTGGSISTDKTFAADGETVTVTPTPGQGYRVASVSFNDGSDHTISAENGVYSFEVPANAASSTITVSATFESEWTAVLQSKLAGSSTDADNPTVIKLDGDVVADSNDSFLAVSSGHHVILDLNGHKIDRNLTEAKTNGQVIMVSGSKSNPASLVIRDSSPGKTGAITGGFTSNIQGAGGIFINYGSVTLESGHITGNACESIGGGAVQIAGGTFTMTGGSITGNVANTSGRNDSECGGAVFFNGDGEVYLKGGSITGNYCQNTPKGCGGISGYDQTNFHTEKICLSGSYILKNNYKGTYNAGSGTWTDTSASDYIHGKHDNIYLEG